MNWTAVGLETEMAGQRDVNILVEAEASSIDPRQPVVLNVMIDRSGSMKGAPLSAAIEAVLGLVEISGSADFLGLVLFDGVAEQRVPVISMDERGKQQMRAALHGIQTGRGTALHSAVELALKGLQRTLVPGRRQRILLLTDGEPSVGPNQIQVFATLGVKLAQENISVHALGLSRHYLADVLNALTQPSGNGFDHVDGPAGLSEVMGALIAHLFGQVASDSIVRLKPRGMASLTCRHSFPTKLEEDALAVMLGDVSRGLKRRVLLSGPASSDAWDADIDVSFIDGGIPRTTLVALTRVSADSEKGRLIQSIAHELVLVSAETSAWTSLARKDLDRSELELETAEASLLQLQHLNSDEVPFRRHADRLADLRMAIERGEGDIPLLVRRAQSSQSETNVSQVIPLLAFRHRR